MSITTTDTFQSGLIKGAEITWNYGWTIWLVRGFYLALKLRDEYDAQAVQFQPDDQLRLESALVRPVRE